MTGIRRLSKSIRDLDLLKENQAIEFPGVLGIDFKGQQLVDVPNREGYVYVRLRNNLNEVIQAYNDKVSPVYDLPIVVVRDKKFERYVVSGRDLGRYENWGNSPYLPRHASQHSFSDSSFGGDIVWVYDRQFVPLSIMPSGSSGAGMVMVNGDTYYWNGVWKYGGGTGTSSILPYKPTGSNARMVLVYLNGDGNPILEPGSYLDISLTGMAQVIPYLPSLPASSGVPLGAVRLLSGTSAIGWGNIYDLRPLVISDGFISPYLVQDEGITRTRRKYLNFKGATIWANDNPGNDSTDIIVSGSSSSGHIIQDEGVSRTNRAKLNFKGAFVWADDNAGNDSTDVSISGANVLDTLRVGNISGGNYFEVLSDGSVRLNGDATAYIGEYVSLINATIQTVGNIVVDTDSGTIQFKTTATYPEEYAIINIQIGQDWATGTPVVPHLHWIQQSTGTPNWLIEARWQVNGNAFVDTWTKYRWLSNHHTYVTGSSMNQISSFSSLAPPSGAKLSEILQVKIYRDFANASAMFSGTDSFNNTALAYTMNVVRQSKGFGSRAEFVD